MHSLRCWRRAPEWALAFAILVSFCPAQGHFAAETGTPRPALSVQINPRTVDFGYQGDRAASAVQTVALTNTGQDPVGILSVAISGANSNDFFQSSRCGAVLAPGETCSIPLTFTPQQAGPAAAALDIATSGGGRQSVALRGTGTDLVLGPAAAGSTSALVREGETASYWLELRPLGSLRGEYVVLCSGAPRGAACITDPDNVELRRRSPQFVNVSVTTSAGPAAMQSAGPVPPVSSPASPATVVGLGVLALLLAMLTMVRPRLRLRRYAAGALAFGAMAFLIACGRAGNGAALAAGNAGAAGTVLPATPAGTYHLTLRVEDGNANVVNMRTLQLIVEPARPPR